MHKKILRIGVSTLIALALMLRGSPAMAFNIHTIISDDELIDATRMSEQEIQTFLQDHKSGLATIVVSGKRASTIIAEASKKFGINPQVLLVILQKEQSLLDTRTPSTKQLQWATGYGVCDSCRLNDVAVIRWRGFETQVNAAAEFFRTFLNDPSRLFLKVGSPTTIDNTLVVPSNIATSMLYSYTPHLHGNEVFWALYNRLFVRQYPEGTLIKSPIKAVVWYLHEGVRRPIRSMAVLKSRFGSQPIITTATEQEIEKYPMGPSIGLANYSLVRTPDGMIALVDGDEYRPIESMDVFRQIGYNPEEIQDIEPATLANYTRSTVITQKSIYPTGILFENPTAHELWYVEDGVKYSILDRVLLKLKFTNRSITRTDSQTLSGYTTGSPILVPDGVLVKTQNSSSVFIIAGAKRRRIPSELVFKTLGYSWKSVVTVSAALFELQGEGAVMDIATPDIPTSDPRPQLRTR